jgi:hypothetical protein
VPTSRARGKGVRHALTEDVVQRLARIAGFFKGAETSRRKRAIATLSGLVGALTLVRAVDDPALRRKSWSRRVVRLGRDYSVSLAQLRARPRRQCDGISAGAR